MSRPVHALGCVFGVSMQDAEYPAWRFDYAECACIDVFACPAPECCGIMRVRSGPPCDEIAPPMPHTEIRGWLPQRSTR